MAIYTQRVAIIIPAKEKPDADAVFGTLDPDVGGANSFTVALTSNGNTLSDWGAYSRMTQDSYNALTTMDNNQFKNYLDSLPDPVDANGDPAPELRPTLGQVQSFKQNVILGAEGQDFWEVVAANGLSVFEGQA